MTAESPNTSNVSVPPPDVSALPPDVSARSPDVSARPDAVSDNAPPANPANPRRTLAGYGLALLACVAVVSALHWWYASSVDRYYHMSVIQGMHQTGGLPSWDLWQMDPGRRTHIYPVAFQVVGYFLSCVGVSPDAFITFLSWALYPALLFTTWLWLFKVLGPRPALAAVIFLSGSTAIFWNQATYNAIAFCMTLAPLALLALESERFLACAVLNLLAATAHPMGLFLPLALAANTLLRRKKLLAGLLAAGLPVLYYAPWFAQLWAYQGCLFGRWNDNDILFMGVGIGSRLSLGVVATLAACLGMVCVLVRRREALGLLGPVLGFAILFPMGFGGHFLLYNLHWPVACLGGYGAGMLFDWLERARPRAWPALSMASAALVFVVLATWVGMEVRWPVTFAGLEETGGPGGSGASIGPGVAGAAEPRLQPKPVPEFVRPRFRFTLEMSALAQLLDPNGWIAPAGGEAAPSGSDSGRSGSEAGRLRKIDAAQQRNVGELVEAIKKQVAADEIIYLPDGPVARLLSGCSGRWTTGGVVRDARSPNVRFRPEDCHFLVTISGSSTEGTKPTRTFTKVFGNSFGVLYKNSLTLPKRAPVPAVVSGLSLVVLTALGMGLVLFDLRLPRERTRDRLLAVGVAFILASACLAKLVWITTGGWLHPPKI